MIPDGKILQFGVIEMHIVKVRDPLTWFGPRIRPDYLVIGRTGSWIPGQSGDGNLKIMIGNLYLKTEQWTLALSSFKEALKYLPPELGNEALKESFYYEIDQFLAKNGSLST